MQDSRTPPDPTLPLSRRVRRLYGIESPAPGAPADLHLPDTRAALVIAGKINDFRRIEESDPQWIHASRLFAAALLSTALRELVRSFFSRMHAASSDSPAAILSRSLGSSGAEDLFRALGNAFGNEMPAAESVDETNTAGYLYFLYWALHNPAMEELRDLFDETPHIPGLAEAFSALENTPLFTVEQGGLSSEDGRQVELLDLIMAPVRHAPDSLEAQLLFIREHWAPWISGLDTAILSALGFLEEESRPRFPPGPGPIEVPRYAAGEEVEPEAFSRDIDWMPRVVLLARNAYVWLSQLSREYDREISRLDEIPDEELDLLASRGFTALWLIGVWERSPASEKIKRWRGDHDAVASAYSLYDYIIAERLGGDAAWDRLKDRALSRGIRLMTDMVPNHVGIDGRWVIEHPDWFIALPECPFPSYRFSGADLCEDERVGIYLEDGYWDNSDAAVVFKRVDHFTGEIRYIYHGNDGTSMPWNDTAQLDYRKAEVREAVIRTILHVARRSPLIRFDAAMTLTRENFRRLWFPEPGKGGDIPSRSAHAMPREEFDRMMPEEFWREVVDRVAAEAPDTLLLAEAFWMLEGYFVRSLGMHRVYNSAFMNMLRDERNADYRGLIRETLEFDPRILSRYVNFMSNPDEATAIEGFGSGDKYFGICTMMATMPGLPMFGHGQIEGLAEKYGMEFHRPRWEEEVNRDLVAAHHRLIFPLLRRRVEFSGVEDFRLYDFEQEDGGIDENVFAYSNGSGGQRSIVVYNNRFSETRGRIIRALPRRLMAGEQPGEIVEDTLAGALRIGNDAAFLRMRDLVSGMEFLFDARRLQDEGMELKLRAYEYRVFLDFGEIPEDPAWRALAGELGGEGCRDLDAALVDLRYPEILRQWKRLSREVLKDEAGERLEDAVLKLMAAVEEKFPSGRSPASGAMDLLEILLPKDPSAENIPLPAGASDPILRIRELLRFLGPRLDGNGELQRHLRRSVNDPEGNTEPAEILLLLEILEKAPPGLFRSPSAFLDLLTEDAEIRDMLGIHRWENRVYFRKEGMESLLRALKKAAEILSEKEGQMLMSLADRLEAASAVSGWQIDRLRELFETGTETTTIS